MSDILLRFSIFNNSGDQVSATADFIHFNGRDWNLLAKHLVIEDIHNSWLYCFTNPLEFGTHVHADFTAQPFYFLFHFCPVSKHAEVPFIKDVRSLTFTLNYLIQYIKIKLYYVICSVTQISAAIYIADYACMLQLNKLLNTLDDDLIW